MNILRQSVINYQQVCPVYHCGHIYDAFNEDTPCPKCFCSVRMVDEAGTNDREDILHSILEKVE